MIDRKSMGRVIFATLRLVLPLVCFQISYSAEASVDETWGSSSTLSAKNFDTGLELKSLKKVGVGATASGALGLFGMNITINLASDFGLTLGYGVSRGFNAANLNIRQAFGGDQIIPYFTAGYSRWFSNKDNDPVGPTTPAFFKNKFLSARERETGNFAENIIYPGLGLEFLNKGGDWQGISFYAEVLYLLDLDDLVANPVAGLGSTYYF